MSRIKTKKEKWRNTIKLSLEILKCRIKNLKFCLRINFWKSIFLLINFKKDQIYEFDTRTYPSLKYTSIKLYLCNFSRSNFFSRSKLNGKHDIYRMFYCFNPDSTLPFASTLEKQFCNEKFVLIFFFPPHEIFSYSHSSKRFSENFISYSSIVSETFLLSTFSLRVVISSTILLSLFNKGALFLVRYPAISIHWNRSGGKKREKRRFSFLPSLLDTRFFSTWRCELL